MADSRLTGLSEEQLEQTVAGLERELAELKSSAPQFIGGSDILNFVSSTGNTYDFNGTLSQDASASTGNSRGTWLVTATADHASTLYAGLLVNLYMNGSLYSSDVGFFDLTHPTVNVYRRFVLNVYTVPNTPATQKNMVSWIVSITGDTQRTIAWKAYVPGLDTASLSFTRLA